MSHRDHGLEVENILGFASPHGHSSPSHSYARHGTTSVSGSGSRGHSLHPPNDCPHCHAYKVHVINASLQDDPALERDWTRTSPGYLESNLGFPPDYDIRRELYQERTNLRWVRRERDDAVALNACYQNEIAILESQLLEAKDRLLAVEMAYDEANFFGEESRGDELLREKAEQEDGPLSSRNDSLDADLGLGMDDWAIEHQILQTDIISNASWSDSDDFELFQQPHHLITQDENLCEDDSSSDALQNQTNSTLPVEVYCTDSSIDSPSSLSSSSLSSSSLSSSSLSASDWAGNQSDDSSSSLARPTSSNEELHNTLKLMASAHKEGNTTDLIKIRKLIARSERTARHERTEAQKYLLLNWRSPSSSNNHSNLAPNQLQPAPVVYPSSSQGRLEIFVDASGSGIGFVFGTRWLAWTFKKTPKIPLGGDGKIVMSWAELLAVEVGLRSLITAGHRSTTITVFSDNMGVIDALNKKSWSQKHGLEESLQIILNLCKDYRIELRPRWVSTKDNLADMPSRGVFPPRSLSFKFPPKLPERLLDLLELAVPPTA
jgi:hypothetical protein